MYLLQDLSPFPCCTFDNFFSHCSIFSFPFILLPFYGCVCMLFGGAVMITRTLPFSCRSSSTESRALFSFAFRHALFPCFYHSAILARRPNDRSSVGVCAVISALLRGRSFGLALFRLQTYMQPCFVGPAQAFYLR